MSSSIPMLAGWYPDAVNGGTNYWDGSRWTGDRRPRRRPFAAAAHHRSSGASLLVLGIVLVGVGSISFWQPEFSLSSIFGPESGSVGDLMSQALRPKSSEDLLADALVTFAVMLAIGLPLAAIGIYLLRGQGPSMQSVTIRLNAEREIARKAARKAAVLDGIKSLRRPAAPSDGRAAAAQIQALSNPATATALQNLHNLLHAGVLTELEFQAAKDRLLGKTQ